jgi:hypothetical protein
MKEPIIADFGNGNGFAVWDHRKKKWILKKIVDGKAVIVPEIGIKFSQECPYCKTKLFLRENLTDTYSGSIIKSFTRKHSNCGKRKERVSGDIEINYLISDEETI